MLIELHFEEKWQIWIRGVKTEYVIFAIKVSAVETTFSVMLKLKYLEMNINVIVISLN
jgi:hypothetical protein